MTLDCPTEPRTPRRTRAAEAQPDTRRQRLTELPLARSLLAAAAAIGLGWIWFALVQAGWSNAGWCSPLFGLAVGIVFRSFADGTGTTGVRLLHAVVAAVVVGVFAALCTVIVAPSEPKAAPAMESDEAAIAALAYDLAAARTNNGEQLDWPPGMDWRLAGNREDFPPALWQDAADQWSRRSSDERNQFHQARRKVMEPVHLERMDAESATWQDRPVAWCALAVVAALAVAATPGPKE